MNAEDLCSKVLDLCEGRPIDDVMSALGSAITLIAAHDGVSPETLIEFFATAVRDSAELMACISKRSVPEVAN